LICPGVDQLDGVRSRASKASGQAFLVGGDKDLADGAGLSGAYESLGNGCSSTGVKMFERFIKPDSWGSRCRTGEEESGDEKGRRALAATQVAQCQLNVPVTEREVPVGSESKPVATKHQLPAASNLVGNRLDPLSQVSIGDSVQCLVGDIEEEILACHCDERGLVVCGLSEIGKLLPRSFELGAECTMSLSELGRSSAGLLQLGGSLGAGVGFLWFDRCSQLAE
jgi:hypothetical protein